MHWQLQPLIRVIVIATLATLAIPRAYPMPSRADIEACTDDAMRLCKAEVDRKDYPAAGSCVLEHRKQLSEGCRAVIGRFQAKAKSKDKKHPKIIVRVPVIVPIPVPKPAPPAPTVEQPQPAEPTSIPTSWLSAAPLLLLIAGLFVGAILYLLRRFSRKQ